MHILCVNASLDRLEPEDGELKSADKQVVWFLALRAPPRGSLVF